MDEPFIRQQDVVDERTDSCEKGMTRESDRVESSSSSWMPFSNADLDHVLHLSLYYFIIYTAFTIFMQTIDLDEIFGPLPFGSTYNDIHEWTREDGSTVKMIYNGPPSVDSSPSALLTSTCHLVYILWVHWVLCKRLKPKSSRLLRLLGVLVSIFVSMLALYVSGVWSVVLVQAAVCVVLLAHTFALVCTVPCYLKEIQAVVAFVFSLGNDNNNNASATKPSRNTATERINLGGDHPKRFYDAVVDDLFHMLHVILHTAKEEGPISS